MNNAIFNTKWMFPVLLMFITFWHFPISANTVKNNKEQPSNLNKFQYYLESYENMDINSVASMFADDILLRDWKISVKGKTEAIRETQKNFQSSESIVIEILRTFESANAVAGELKITVNSTEVLYVTDVVTFNSDGKITSVRAYIGRED
ncbi:nuclear transport factor 2 family protein [Thalassotalea euphylliae]|uniref:nuclear transport factor 2 family protein n=1 Tax=Thalassotalea euphylliae TaxID=1655234 RepID=UPI003643CD03